MGYFLSQCSEKVSRVSQSSGLIHCGVDRLQVCHERLYVLVGYIFAGIPELMDDTVLNLCLGERRFNCMVSEEQQRLGRSLPIHLLLALDAVKQLHRASIHVETVCLLSKLNAK